MKPYFIDCPMYSNGVGGSRALHRLCHLLNEKGYSAYVASTPNPLWNEKRMDIKDLTDDFIVVYPEVIWGNPLKSKKVVRWALNKPGLLGGSKRVNKKELLFTWDKSYIDIPNVLKVNTIEFELFTKGTNDEYDCFYVNKGKNKPRVKELEGLREITNTYPETRQDLADFLKKTRIMYSYDDNSQLNYEALLCGCRVILVPEKVELVKEDFDKKYNEFNLLHKLQLNNFIKLTQEM